MLIGCSEIKPITLPSYNPPDFSSIKRPQIPVPVEGKDYFIDTEKNTVTYTVSGQDLLTAKVISERTAWQIIEMMKQMFDIQTEIIRQKDQLIVMIDLKRQYAEREKAGANIEKWVAEILAVIIAAVAIASF
jgi:hypothetical protein